MHNKNADNQIERIRVTLTNVLPKGSAAWLFGSRARGDSRADSDWDILVVVDKDRLTFKDYSTITYPLTELGWDMGEEINPVMYTRQEWDENVNTPFRDNVERDAILLVS